MFALGGFEFCLWVKWLRDAHSIPTQDAEDIVADAVLYLINRFLRHHPHATEREIESYLAAYPNGVLRQCLHQRALNFKRDKAREQLRWTQTAAQYVEYERDMCIRIITELEAQELIEAFPSSVRSIAQRFVEGYSWREIAQLEGLSVSAVKMRFYRGVEWVRTQLGLRCDDSFCSGVNYAGVADTVSDTEHFTEEVSDENRLRACEYGGAFDSECVDVPSRPCDYPRNAGGGGSTTE